VIPFFAFPPEVRRVIYTTNAIESLQMRLRKIITARGHFPRTMRRSSSCGWRSRPKRPTLAGADAPSVP
jgi:hypothetical protein